MRYMLMFFDPQEEFAKRENPALAGEYWGAWGAYVKTIQQSGIVVTGHGLEPPAVSTSVRLRDGNRQVQDGPIADTKEQLGGYFIIDVPDLDTALDWAAKAPSAASGAVEIRPLMKPMPAA